VKGRLWLEDRDPGVVEPEDAGIAIICHDVDLIFLIFLFEYGIYQWQDELNFLVGGDDDAEFEIFFGDKGSALKGGADPRGFDEAIGQ
jgi:hypothetical protein